MSVIASIEPRVIPTYPVGSPEKNPVFFEKRVYQGSSGKVYPVPFIDKVHDEPVDVTYDSVRLENDYVRLVMLPEIGGRIFLGQDKTNHDYDFFYRQDVIKPALVGLAGPWISGGVEFNWPQHHRPGTFMPCDYFIEEEEGGARTLWMSEHDPIRRLKGMHGVRLRPDSSLIELRARLYNRTDFTQSFLWWANVAAMVHDQYQSFFPPDVDYVADHAVRAMSSFPEANNPYYGVNYQDRPGMNDLSWYRNIPVPTSYMVCQTQFDFFGGYDHKAGGGFVHVADRHIAPGKKQWTWGNHPFGYAWDRELTDANGPYVELMAGVYTDNQPDFSYLSPFETKTFSQYWWPIQGIGPVQQATEDVALRFVVREDRVIEMGVCVSSPLKAVKLAVRHRGEVIYHEILTLSVGESWRHDGLRFVGDNEAELHVQLSSPTGDVLLDYCPPVMNDDRSRELATEPAEPEVMSSVDELYLTGEHLELYRHPTRSPESYWLEALKRDGGDCRCNLAMGRRHLQNGRFAEADEYLSRAIERLTHRHPNPETGEAHYCLGLSKKLQGDLGGAYSYLAKATWNYAWRSAANYQLACIDSSRGDVSLAIERLNESIAHNRENSKAQVLMALLLRDQSKLEAIEILQDVLQVDPLDHWARSAMMLLGELSKEDFLKVCRNDAQTILDIVFDYADAGFSRDANFVLQLHLDHPVDVSAVPNPMGHAVTARYVMAWLQRDAKLLEGARKQSPDYCFPSRLHEQLVLQWALDQGEADPVAAYGMGNYCYDRGRYDEALGYWRRSIHDGASFATVYRNLGIGLWNLERDGENARASYLKAIELDPEDSRLLSEYDQLCAKLNDAVESRLNLLQENRDLVFQRDDCTVALASLNLLMGHAEEALKIITSKRFHPWEGGEGKVLRQFTTAHLHLGKAALRSGDAQSALMYFDGAMKTPESLGEAYHLLQAKADVNYWKGKAFQLMGRYSEAESCFLESAQESGDFSEMAVKEYSPLSYYRGLSLRELGQSKEADVLFQQMKKYAEDQLEQVAKIDYFATSLPNLLVFDEDLQARRDAECQLLIALACMGLGDFAEARVAAEKVIDFDRANEVAVSLLREIEVL